MNYLKHERRITVAVNSMDFTEKLKPSAIMGYFQDIATEHADMLGFGYDDMKAKNLAWVMVRMSFTINKSPSVSEIITISTYPEKPKASDVNRGYYVHNEAGLLLIAGSSKWCVLDMSTQRIARCTPLFERFSDDAYAPCPPLEDANPKLGKLSGNAEPDRLIRTVEITDLDHNGHMNNTRYGDVILNTLDMELLQRYAICRCDINFMAQLFIGDRYEVFKERQGDTMLIEARMCETDVVVFKAKCIIEPL